MKQIFHLIATAVTASLALVSCNKEAGLDAVGSETVNVKFNVGTEVWTKATGDGAAATDLYVAVYAEDASEYTALRQHMTATYPQEVALELVKGKTYKVVFLAQSTDAYVTEATPDLKAITLPYGAVNSEALDLFTAVDDLTVDDVNQINITLKRPFARVNFATSEASITAAQESGFSVSKVELTFSSLPISFNLYDGSLSGGQNVTFTEATPADETLSTGYKTLAFVYLPATDSPYLTNAILNINDGARTITVGNLPVRSNYRTNVFGNFLTSSLNYTVNLDPGFAGENPVSLEEQANLNSVISQINAGAFTGTKIELNPAVDGSSFDFSGLDAPLTVPVEVAAGKSATITELETAVPTASAAAITVNEGSSLVLIGSSISATGSGSRGMNINAGSTVTIENSTVTGRERGLNLLGDGDKVEVTGSTISSTDYYAINLPGTAVNSEVILKDSEVNGWCILNVWNTGNTFTLTNCTLNATNKYSGTSNAFGAFVFNVDGVNTVDIIDSRVNIGATGDQPEYLIMSKDREFNGLCPVVNFKGTTKIKGTTTKTYYENAGTDDETGETVNLYIINFWPGYSEYTLNLEDSVAFEGEWDSPEIYL